MRTWWTWVFVLALGLSPALADARAGRRDRGDRGGRETSADRRSDRAEQRHPRPHPWASSDRPHGNESPRISRDSGDSSRGRRDFERGRGSGSSRGWDRDRQRQSNRWQSDRQWQSDRRDDRNRYESHDRGSQSFFHSRGYYRTGPRRDGPAYRYRPRYPAYYRHGYVHLHGYYFPRYYYDSDAYPTHASIRLLVEPSEAEVYVDGYYAGVVDDYDGVFQRLHLAPGPHEITLRLPGYRTWSVEVYATPDRTLSLRHDMLPGASGPEYGQYPYEEPDPDEEPAYEQP